MTRYIVLEPGEGRSADAVILRDRFHPVAFVLPFVWLAAHRLYLEAVFAFALQLALLVLGGIEGLALMSVVCGVLFGLAVALEGPMLVVTRLRRRGHREAAVVHASDLAEAELLYFGPGGAPAAAPETAGPAAPAPLSPRTLPLFGWRSGRDLLDAGRA